MEFRIQDVPKSAVSEFSFGAMACCIISYDVSLVMNHGELTKGAFAIISVAAIIFIGWLIWFFRMYLGGKKVTLMPRVIGRVVEAIGWILLAMWILVSWQTKLCHPVWAISAWCLWVGSFIYYLFHSSKNGTNT